VALRPPEGLNMQELKAKFPWTMNVRQADAKITELCFTFNYGVSAIGYVCDITEITSKSFFLFKRNKVFMLPCLCEFLERLFVFVFLHVVFCISFLAGLNSKSRRIELSLIKND